MVPANPKNSSVRRALSAMAHTLFRDMFDPYRPERHYMRGPGPKWHAKHAPTPSLPNDIDGMMRAGSRMVRGF